MHPRNNWGGRAALGLAPMMLIAASLAAPLRAQTPASAAPAIDDHSGEYTIRTDVNLVVLHATVVDQKGNLVNDLKREDFKVFEDGVPQKLSVFSHADIPVTMGIVIDDSGSMKSKRAAVNASALSFVKTSNPQDQVFVVNFNDVYYLDTPGDFAANIEELKAALDKIDSRGGTALYDAIYASVDHLKLGDRDKKVLLVVSDGDDNASRYTFQELLAHAQKSNATIYTIGLLGEEEPGGLFRKTAGAKKFGKILRELAEATGGQGYFPKSLEEVQSTCVDIAHSIRNQYTLAYYPSNARRDGGFRSVHVDAARRKTRFSVRTRTGYYAPQPRPASGASSGN